MQRVVQSRSVQSCAILWVECSLHSRAGCSSRTDWRPRRQFLRIGSTCARVRAQPIRWWAVPKMVRNSPLPAKPGNAVGSNSAAAATTSVGSPAASPLLSSAPRAPKFQQLRRRLRAGAAPAAGAQGCAPITNNLVSTSRSACAQRRLERRLHRRQGCRQGLLCRSRQLHGDTFASGRPGAMSFLLAVKGGESSAFRWRCRGNSDSVTR